MNFMLAIGLVVGAYLYPTLQEKLSSFSSDEPIPVLVHLVAKPDFYGKRGLSYKEYVNYLKQFCENSQREILLELQSKYRAKIYEIRPYWIFNGFYLKATKEVILYLATRSDIEYIIDDQIISLSKFSPIGEVPKDKAIEWNVLRVRADSCWLAGYDGTGVVVAHMDTGVDPNHPALSGKWLGSPYWFDAVSGQTTPYDDNGHGTHTMGTILGGDGYGPFSNDIGVAPGAKFVSCKIFNNQGTAQSSWIHAGFQKIAEWKSQGVNIVVSSNSWGSTDITSTEFWQDVMNWRNLDIIPVFAAGNNGPNSGTINTPGSFPTVLGVGATNNSDYIAVFSCRGPAPNQTPWNDTSYWPRTDWNFIKPDISAPGVSIRSSIPGGSYGYSDGTSMATPHVAGAVAILKQKNPGLSFEQIYNLIVENADRPSQGAPYPNNNYGWGILNIYQALLATPSPQTPYIVFINKNFTDENSNGVWDPGETIQIFVTLRNMGSEANNVSVNLDTSTEGINLLDNTTTFNQISTNQEVTNASDPFVVQAASTILEGTNVNFTLNIECEGGYTWSYSFSIVIGIPGVDYVDHSPGNILLTVTRYGTLGYMGSNQAEGNGCRYPSSSVSHLYYGSFAVATDSVYVVDRYFESGGSDDDDWVTLTSPDGRVKMYRQYGEFYEFSKAAYSDENGEISRGLVVYQRGYSFNTGYGRNYVILEFTLYNNSPELIQNLYAGLFTDWDVGGGSGASSNAGGTDNTRNMAYLYYSSTFMGTAILNPSRQQTQLIANKSVIDHEIYVYPYGGLPDSLQWKFLTGTYSTASTNRNYDWSTVVSAGPFTLPPYDSVKVAFCVAGASSIQNLRTFIDDAYARYWGIVVPNNEILEEPKLVINKPLRGNELKFTVPLKGPITISVYDVKGSLIYTTTLNSKSYTNTVKLPQLATGMYFIKISTPKGDFSEKTLIVR
ncbi:MAG: S8 family peptidase [candidate division WOR-3 bacterium]